ncbi:MAG: hypothetical protein BMS9Abin29_1807 [Gemmatimonadota bacterium]|nr:MAG: hypothetical protein BMS9Abin29_1807 [Gemmatimonadota bacterium]
MIRIRLLVWLAIVFTALSSLAVDSAAQGRTLVIESFDVTVQVAESGRIDVLESIRFRFSGSWNGIYRLIPVNYGTAQGFNYKLFLEVESVTDESGRRLEYKDTRERHYRKLKVWVPGAQNTTRTIHFRYSVPNALRFFDSADEDFAEGRDELYWNVTGDEWEIPIERASARVELPARVTGLQARAFTGAFRSTTQDARIDEIESGFYFETSRSLGPREGLTIAVAWSPGVVSRPSAIAKSYWFLRANLIFLLPLISLSVMWRLWLNKGRDPARRPIAPQYEPPEGLTPAEIGTLIDNRPDMRDITASMVDLAVRGFMRIEERERRGFASIFGGNEYAFVMLKGPDEWNELQSHERTLLGGFFDSGLRPEVELGDLENEFYKDVSRIRDDLYGRLVELGLYARRPDKVIGIYSASGAVILVLSAVGARILADQIAVPISSMVIAGILTALPVFAFGFVMPARTIKGARALEHVLGFQEFLDRVESDHFKRMIDSPEMFERYLPHAMALGVEKRWARAFDDIYREPPDWYRGAPGTHFRPTLFVTNLGAMSSRAGSAMSSQPRSSGGSGFSGGGGGGGFGGGGGGGF